MAANDIVDEILSFKELPDGWHYGEGRGATTLAVEGALWTHSLFLKNNAMEVEVFPDVDGGILMSGYCGDETVDIFCGATGRIDIVHERDSDVVHEKNGALPHDLRQYLRG